MPWRKIRQEKGVDGQGKPFSADWSGNGIAGEVSLEQRGEGTDPELGAASGEEGLRSRAVTGPRVRMGGGNLWLRGHGSLPHGDKAVGERREE